MKNSLISLLLFVLVLGLAPAPEVFAKSNSNEKVIVLFKDKVDKKLVAQAKGKINREYKNVHALAISVPPQAIKGLKNNPNILSVEQDQIIQVKQSQDWGIKRIEAPAAWESSFTGKGVKVAVVDTGIVNHEDLIVSGGASFVSYTDSYFDDNGHGTHAAGIIGARNNSLGTVGIAHEASMYAVKALDQNGSGYLSDIVAGIDWAITNDMDIINLSLGTTVHSSTLKEAVDIAYSQGGLVVAAAGNNGTADGSGDTVNFPARYDSVIAVSATDSNDNRASFSATGNTVEVAAPGVNVLSTYLKNGYTYMSGTSMATPYAAGNLALLKQANPTLSHTELRAKLQQNAIDLGVQGKDSWFGYGLIQAPTSQQEESDPVIETTTVVSTNKTIYRTGEYVYITVKVSDKNGTALPDSGVSIAILAPNGKLTGTATTGSDGKATFKMATSKKSAKGTYQVEAESTTINYENSLGTTSFQLK